MPHATRDYNDCVNYFFVYRTVTLFGCPFQSNSTKLINNNSRDCILQIFIISQPPYHNTHRLSRNIGLGSSPFAHHYKGNHFRFLFLALLRCFSSRSSPPYHIYSDRDTSGLPKAGCPIRKSSDQSLIDSSPKLMAVFHLLHRLLMPQASTKCPFQLTTNFAGYSNIEHSLIHIFQRSQIFYYYY